ncbi:MAG: hypothetical protein P8105_01675 [Dehalococcoidia bacterium]
MSTTGALDVEEGFEGLVGVVGVVGLVGLDGEQALKIQIASINIMPAIESNFLFMFHSLQFF